MIYRIRDRTTFVDLRRRGRRVREGPVTVTYLPDVSTPPRVAYSVGRRVGPAVVRNQVTRRLRAIMRQAAEPTNALAGGPGAYLVTVRPEAATMSYSELEASVHGALGRLTPRSSP